MHTKDRAHVEDLKKRIELYRKRLLELNSQISNCQISSSFRETARGAERLRALWSVRVAEDGAAEGSRASMGSITVEPRGDIAVFTVTGDITYQELATAFRQHYPVVAGQMIWDFSMGNVGSLTIDQFRLLPAVARTFCTKRALGAKTAFVCPADLSFGLFRMYVSMAEFNGTPFRYSVFRSHSQALEWLAAEE